MEMLGITFKSKKMYRHLMTLCEKNGTETTSNLIWITLFIKQLYCLVIYSVINDYNIIYYSFFPSLCRFNSLHGDFFLDLLWYFELLLSASYEFRCASKTFPHSLLVEQTLEWEDVLDGCTFEPEWCFCDWSKNTAGSPGCQYIRDPSRSRTRAERESAVFIL